MKNINGAIVFFMGGPPLAPINASSRKNALNMINNSQRAISKKNSLEEAAKFDNPVPQKIGDR